MSFSIKIHQIQSNFALFLGEGAGSHETQASLEPAMWLRLALMSCLQLPSSRITYMYTYAQLQIQSFFFFEKMF